MRVFCKQCLLPVLFCLPHLAGSQVLPFHYYSIRDGLLSNSINVVYQDSRGMLWIGTTDGVSVYDGVTFRNYTTADGLTFSHVNDITESHLHPGTMFLATNGGGVNTFRHNAFTSVRFGESPWANRVNCVIEDHNGTLWCGADQGIFRVLPSGTVEPFFPERGFVNINSIAETADSLIWITSTEGLFVYGTISGNLQQFAIGPAKKQMFFRMFKQGENDLWIPASDSLLVHIHGTTIVQRIKMSHSYPQSVIIQDNGTIWTGSGDGVDRISVSDSTGAAERHYTTENGLQDNAIVAGIVDREGSLWFISPSRGLSRLSDHSIERFPHSFEFDYANNQMAAQDRNGHFWIALGRYLCEFWKDAESGWRHFHHQKENSPLIETAASLQFDTSGNLWVRTYPSSFVGYRITPQPGAHSSLRKLSSFDVKKDFPHAVPLCFIIDRRNHLWTTTDAKSVAEYELRTQKLTYVYLPEQGLPDLNVRAMFGDSQGNVWFGEYIGGAVKVNPATHEMNVYTTADGLPENSVRAFAEDNRKRIWIGMRYGGIAMYDKESITPLSDRRPFLSKATSCLAQGADGRMWAGTISGFIGIHDSLAGSPNLINENLSGERIYSCCIDARGPILLVTAEGLTVYSPKDDRQAVSTFPIYITDISVNGQGKRPDSSLSFSSNENNCTIGYICINFASSHSISYRTKLEPNDAEWQPATAQRAISYGSLKPGSYRFSVVAVSPTGAEITSASTVSFEIARPYWQAWWFIVLVILLFASLITLMIQARIRRMVHIERIRSRIAADLHDDIGSGLIRIALLSEVIHRQLSPRGTRVRDESDGGNPLSSTQTVGKIARELVDVMSDVVWSIDPKNEVLMKLLQRIEALAIEQCESLGIQLTFDVTGSLPTQKLGSQALRCILLITKEALANIAKHAACRNVTIRIRSLPEKRALSLAIADDGIGFDIGALPRMNGLYNMRMRAESIGGTIEVVSSKGKGTTIETILPI